VRPAKPRGGYPQSAKGVAGLKTTFRTEDEAKRVSRRTLLRAGWHDARITEAVEKPSKRGNDMIELTVVVPDADGTERQLRDWLTDSDMGAAKLRSCCQAVDALDRYEAGEISQADFPGNDVRVKIEIEKRRGYPDQNRIEEYRPAAASTVVNLRATS
jgi:hypothetical protein